MLVNGYSFCNDQVVDTIEAEAEGLIEVPRQDERVGTVGDHLNFRLVRPSDEENLAFRVCNGVLEYETSQPEH